MDDRLGKHLPVRIFNPSVYSYICSPFIDRHYSKAILDLAARNVSVKVITRERQSGGVNLRQYFEQSSNYGKNFQCAFVSGQRYPHLKMYVVDDNFAARGSTNLTIQGLYKQMNEISLYEHLEEVQEVKADFEKLWQRYSTRITYAKAGSGSSSQ